MTYTGTRALRRVCLSLLAGTLGVLALACAHPRQAIPQSRVPSVVAAHAPGSATVAPVRHDLSRRVGFTTQIQPILAARCQPCHFAGGKMYASLPFDRAGTTLRLREKLFTRLKDENERRVIRQ